MTNQDSAIATFTDHQQAEKAIKQLAASGFPMKHLSIVGKGYHTEEKVTGFYSTGDRMTFWGTRGAFWGGLWGLFLGGMIMTIPVFGQVVVLGWLASTVVAAVEGAVVVGGLSALGAAIASIGIPKDSVVNYETAIAADGFLVMVHGEPAEMTRARSILASINPANLDLHMGRRTTMSAGELVGAAD